LDGFEHQAIRHNLANGLRWGPDGWLYGRHGIQAISSVGVPGSSELDRLKLSCGIWRWHPLRHHLEIVCEGTTNPWGHDWDQHGQLFFINTVIGHLWHAIPGAHLQRMYGEDSDSRVYELLPQIADHFHFDNGHENWTAIRKLGVTPGTDRAGGGHAHSGMMIYQGQQWPEAYRGKLFTLNYHGRRLNVDRLDRVGAGYVGRHEPDLIHFPDLWFRGIELTTGPDGSVYVLDWSDIGECHDNDGIHRHSGVVYRISYGQTPPPSVAIDLYRQSESQLLPQIHSPNAWIARQARLLLAERASRGAISEDTIHSLTNQLQAALDPLQRLAAMWTLAHCQKLDQTILNEALNDPHEHVRIQAIQLLADPTYFPDDITPALASVMAEEPSDLVALHVASALQRVHGSRWWEIMAQLTRRRHLANDRDYPLLLWYALRKPLMVEPEAGLGLLRELDRKSPESSSGGSRPLPFADKLVRFAARQWASQLPRDPQPVNQLLRLASTASPLFQHEVLRGLDLGLLGRSKVAAPANWSLFAESLSGQAPAEAQELSLRLGTLFGDGVAAEGLAAIVADKQASAEARTVALQAMAENRLPATKKLAYSLINDRFLGPTAITSLLAVSEVEDARELLELLAKQQLSPAARHALLQALPNHREYLPLFFEAVADGTIPKLEVEAATLRQLRLLDDPSVNQRLEELWPSLPLLNRHQVQRIQELETKLSPEVLAKAQLGKGRTTWNKLCASCHRLYGQGGTIGPELTGAQRSNLRYLTENILDPSGSVAANYRVSLFLQRDGTLLSGVVVGEDETTFSVQTVKEKVVIDKGMIEERKDSTQSLMPEGLLDALTDEERRDLIGYLMASRQVAAD
jgi:putative membrane-bound dehydrogenase-like protein